MNTMLIHAALFLVGSLALAGFACYVCRGRPAAISLGRRRAGERRMLREIEGHLLAEVKTTDSDHSLEAGVDGL